MTNNSNEISMMVAVVTIIEQNGEYFTVVKQNGNVRVTFEGIPSLMELKTTLKELGLFLS